MTLTSLCRRTTTALALTASVGLLLVGTAAPGSAGGARSTSHAGTWTFGSGSVSGTLSRDVSLTDYASAEYYDRVTATPGRGDKAVSIGDEPCKPGSYYTSGLSLFAEPTDWVQKVQPVETVTAGRVRIACTDSDGVLHHFRWGSYTDAAAQAAMKNCVVITRSDAQTFTISAPAGCQAQDEVVDKNGNTVGTPLLSDIAFSATLHFPTLK